MDITALVARITDEIQEENARRIDSIMSRYQSSVPEDVRRFTIEMMEHSQNYTIALVSRMAQALADKQDQATSL